jgi:hypothetical protein
MINVLINNAAAKIVPMSEHSPSLNNESDWSNFEYWNLNIASVPKMKTDVNAIAMTISISCSLSAPLVAKSVDELATTPIPNNIIMNDIAVDALSSRRFKCSSFSFDIFPGMKNLHNTTTELNRSFNF